MIYIKDEALIKAIGLKVKSLREQKGLSQTDLSHEADLILSQIGRIERGETNPTISTLNVLAKALGVTLPELVNVQPEKKATGKK